MYFCMNIYIYYLNKLVNVNRMSNFLIVHKISMVDSGGFCDFFHALNNLLLTR